MKKKKLRQQLSAMTLMYNTQKKILAEFQADKKINEINEKAILSCEKCE